jgi:HK97 family phage prohead protease
MRDQATMTSMTGGRRRVRFLRDQTISDGLRTRLYRQGEVADVPAVRAAQLQAVGVVELAVPSAVTKEAPRRVQLHLEADFVLAKDAGPLSRKVRAIASTDAVDRHGDIVRQSGWRLEPYRKNPIILFGHDHQQPIGRAVSVALEKGRLLVEIEFATGARAEEIFGLVRSGVVRGISVGFLPLKHKMREDGRGLEFTEAELLEISIVSVPANPEALIEGSLPKGGQERAAAGAAPAALARPRLAAAQAAMARLRGRPLTMDERRAEVAQMRREANIRRKLIGRVGVE